MYRALVFDIGNTLVRSADFLESAYLEVFGRHGIPREKLQLFRQFAGRAKHLLFAEALGNVPGKAELVRECMKELEEILVKETASLEEVPGASACVRALDERGWRIAMTSGFPRSVGATILARFGWTCPVVCDGDVQEHRPAPDPVFKACQLLGVTPAEAIVIGDTPQDVRSAQAAGACSIAVTTGKFGSEELAQYHPTFVIAGIWELPALLEREFSSVHG